MSLAPLEPSDRDAVSQLRVLLRGEHGLTVKQEEDLVAAFLAGRASVGSLEQRANKAQLPTLARDKGLLLHAAILQTGVIASAASFSLYYAASSGSALFYDAYGTSSEVAAMAGLSGLLLLMLLPIRAMFGRRLPPAAEYLSTAVCSGFGAALIESAMLHWPTFVPSQSWHGFIVVNVLALFLAGIVIAGTIGYALARRPARSMRTKERLATNHQPRLASHNQG
jgi:hypothetical protein